MSIRNEEELKEKIKKILKSAEATLEKLKRISADNFLFDGKFGKLGTKLSDNNLQEDLGEQVQQSMTILMTCYAVDWLNRNTSCQYPFETNEAEINGADIFKEGKMTCEVFTSTDPKNNEKIYHDLNAVAIKSEEAKYVFYCSPADKKFSPGKKKQHSSSTYHFDITDIRWDSESEIYVSGKYIPTKKKKSQEEISYKEKKVTLIHITPCELHQWVNKILSTSSGVSGLSSEE